MRKTQLKYPEFLKCCNHTDDMFWKFIFEDLAYGNTPYNVYIYKGNLCCNTKGREFTYRIDFSDDQALFETVYDLFTSKLNIISQSDKESTYKNFISEKEDSNIGWGDIKKKNLKDILLQRYVIDMKNKYSLSIFQAKRLLSSLYVLIYFKYITSEHIQIKYVDKKLRIESIAEIEFKNGEYKLEKEY